MWSDRFIKLPIQVYDKQQKELTGKEILEDSYIKINPLDISLYRPTYDDFDPEQKEITSVTTKYGDTTLVQLSVWEFEKQINDFLK